MCKVISGLSKQTERAQPLQLYHVQQSTRSTLQTLLFCHSTKAEREKKATRRRNRKHVFFHLVRLLAQSDSSCFFQPGVFGVERVHTIPEQEEDLHMKRGKIIFYLSNRNSDRGLWVSLPACCWGWSSLRVLRSRRLLLKME